MTTGTCPSSLATTNERPIAHPRACCLFVLGLTLVRLSLCLCLSLSLSLSRAHRNPTGPTQRMHPTPGTDGRIVHTFTTRTNSVTRPHQQCSTSFGPRAAFRCFPTAPVSGGSSSDWWDGWSGTYHGWHTNRAGPRRPGHERCAQAARSTAADAGPDAKEVPKQAQNAQRPVPRATLRRTSSWREIGRSAHDPKFADAADAEETYHNAIRGTLERTEALEKHVKTVTMRADSLATTEADFFQTLIERQEESIRELNTLYGQLCQPRPTQW